MKTNRFLQIAKKLFTTSTPASTTSKYCIGSWFLYDSFKYCTQIVQKEKSREDQSEPEWMHYATGPILSGVKIVDRIVTFNLSQQTPTFVMGERQSTRDSLIRMAEFGYPLHMVCHSHPGHGHHANHPSDTDIDHQSRLELGGYRCISCIYSRDGYVRFFSLDFPFEIEIFGEGVKTLGYNTFYLTKVN